jgi:hypothetical protein
VQSFSLEDSFRRVSSHCFAEAVFRVHSPDGHDFPPKTKEIVGLGKPDSELEPFSATIRAPLTV